MNTAGSEISAEVVGSVEAADAIAWDRMVGSEGSPFVEHAWLLAMERSRCVQAAVGWTPQILVARRAGRVVGAVPLVGLGVAAAGGQGHQREGYEREQPTHLGLLL